MGGGLNHRQPDRVELPAPVMNHEGVVEEALRVVMDEYQDFRHRKYSWVYYHWNREKIQRHPIIVFVKHSLRYFMHSASIVTQNG